MRQSDVNAEKIGQLCAGASTGERSGSSLDAFNSLILGCYARKTEGAMLTHSWLAPFALSVNGA
jgi:hypothetical protein